MDNPLITLSQMGVEIHVFRDYIPTWKPLSIVLPGLKRKKLEVNALEQKQTQNMYVIYLWHIIYIFHYHDIEGYPIWIPHITP